MSINTKQGKISGDKVSTGNKCFIADKRPSINTQQGKISGEKGSTGNKNYIGEKNDRPSIPSKIQSHVTKVQWEIKVLLVPKDRSFIQNKVKSLVTKV